MIDDEALFVLRPADGHGLGRKGFGYYRLHDDEGRRRQRISDAFGYVIRGLEKQGLLTFSHACAPDGFDEYWKLTEEGRKELNVNTGRLE